MALIKLVGKTFVVHQKFAKTVKVFFCIGFVVYGIWLFSLLGLPKKISRAWCYCNLIEWLDFKFKP